MRSSVSLLVINLWASTVMSAADTPLTACLPAPDEIRYQTLMVARGYATRIYRGIGIDLHWKTSCKTAEVNAPGTVSSPNLRTLGIRWSSHAPSQVGPSAYASAFLLQPTGIRVELYLDRILVLLHRLDPNTGAAVLGHVLAHEIGHVLLQKEGHAQDGLMNAYWTTKDEEEMRTRLFRFQDEDAATIRDHLRRQEPQLDLDTSARVGKDRRH